MHLSYKTLVTNYDYTLGLLCISRTKHTNGKYVFDESVKNQRDFFRQVIVDVFHWIIKKGQETLHASYEHIHQMVIILLNIDFITSTLLQIQLCNSFFINMLLTGCRILFQEVTHNNQLFHVIYNFNETDLLTFILKTYVNC